MKFRTRNKTVCAATAVFLLMVGGVSSLITVGTISDETTCLVVMQMFHHGIILELIPTYSSSRPKQKKTDMELDMDLWLLVGNGKKTGKTIIVMYVV